MPEDCRVIAIVAAYNEGDVIASVIGDLVAQGIQVYLIDHCSTDDTISRASKFLGEGLLRIERFPDESGFPAEDAHRFAWENILKRKATLTQELDADWFIHHDADEFRESPWAHLNLRQGIALVDRLGFNAIDFEVLNFRPTGEAFTAGDDVRTVFEWHEPAGWYDKRQIKCWKRNVAVDLASSGGHEAEFPDRRIFPLRFLLRHYPIRGQAHGERKVFQERHSRFSEAERARGWHVQYDGIEPAHTFVYDRAVLVKYDPDQVRVALALRHRGVEELERALASTREVLDDRQRDLGVMSAQSAERGRQLEDLAQHLRTLDQKVDDQAQTIQALRQDVMARDMQIAQFDAEHKALEAQHQALATTLQNIYASRSWRYTALLRRAGRAGSRSDP